MYIYMYIYNCRIVFKINMYYGILWGEKMDFPKGTIFREEIDPKTGEKVKIAILPDGTELKFFTEEDFESI